MNMFNSFMQVDEMSGFLSRRHFFIIKLAKNVSSKLRETVKTSNPKEDSLRCPVE